MFVVKRSLAEAQGLQGGEEGYKYGIALICSGLGVTEAIKEDRNLEKDTKAIHTRKSVPCICHPNSDQQSPKQLRE